MGTFQNAFYPKQEHSPWADVHPHGVGRQPKKTGPPQPSSTMGASALTSSTGMRRRRRMETVKVLTLVHNGVLWGQGPPARTFRPLRRVHILRTGPMRHVLHQLELHLHLQMWKIARVDGRQLNPKNIVQMRRVLPGMKPKLHVRKWVEIWQVFWILLPKLVLLTLYQPQLTACILEP